MTRQSGGKFLPGPPFESGFEFVPHTADIAVRLRARTREELFRVAAAAFTEALTDRTAVLGTATRRVELAAAELDLLLVDWLAELLFLFETEGFLAREADVHITGGIARATDDTEFTKEEPEDSNETGLRGYAISATLHGETHDPSRHPLNVLIKAVTYHGLHITRTGEGYEARVIFDI